MGAAAGPLASVEHGEVEGHPSVTLHAGTTSATFVPALGMLGTSLRHDGGEHLALQGGAAAVKGGHTTGLPLLAPWANRIRGDYVVDGRIVRVGGAPGLHHDPDGQPIHGTMLGRAGWRFERTGTTDGSAAHLVADFDAAAADEVMASFPFPHELRVTATVGAGHLEVAVSLTATGTVPVPVSFGWHPYFRLPDEELADLRLELPAWHHLHLDEQMLPTGRETSEEAQRRPLPPEGLDDAYRLLAQGRSIGLVGRRRSLVVTPGPGYHFAQLYAQPRSPVVAIEPMVAAIDALGAGTTPMVGPGETYTARFRVELR